MVVILIGDEVHFTAFVSYFQKGNKQDLKGVYRCRATLLCLLGAFLFVGGSANGGPVILLSVVKSMYRNQTPMPLVVAETMLRPYLSLARLVLFEESFTIAGHLQA